MCKISSLHTKKMVVLSRIAGKFNKSKGDPAVTYSQMDPPLYSYNKIRPHHETFPEMILYSSITRPCLTSISIILL